MTLNIPFVFYAPRTIHLLPVFGPSFQKASWKTTQFPVFWKQMELFGFSALTLIGLTRRAGSRVTC